MDKAIAIILFCAIAHSTFAQPLRFEPQEEEARGLGHQIGDLQNHGSQHGDTLSPEQQEVGPQE